MAHCCEGHLAGTKLGGLQIYIPWTDDDTKWLLSYLTQGFSLLLPTFGLSEVPIHPSVFGIVPPYLCCVFMGIGIVSAENYIALLANFVTKDHLAHPFTCSVSFAKRVSHFPQ